jgi:hypothetical protein
MADRYRLYKSASPCCDAPSPWLRRCRYRGQSVCSGGRAPPEWELVEVDDALRPPAGASKVHESFLDACDELYERSGVERLHRLIAETIEAAVLGSQPC